MYFFTGALAAFIASADNRFMFQSIHFLFTHPEIPTQKCSNDFVLTQSLHAYFPQFLNVYEYLYYIFHEYLIFS